jgi:hypothetical protein
MSLTAPFLHRPCRGWRWGSYVCVPSRGPNVLFCMPNRSTCAPWTRGHAVKGARCCGAQGAGDAGDAGEEDLHEGPRAHVPARRLRVLPQQRAALRAPRQRDAGVGQQGRPLFGARCACSVQGGPEGLAGASEPVRSMGFRSIPRTCGEFLALRRSARTGRGLSVAFALSSTPAVDGRLSVVSRDLGRWWPCHACCILPRPGTVLPLFSSATLCGAGRPSDRRILGVLGSAAIDSGFPAFARHRCSTRTFRRRRLSGA